LRIASCRPTREATLKMVEDGGEGGAAPRPNQRENMLMGTLAAQAWALGAAPTAAAAGGGPGAARRVTPESTCIQVTHFDLGCVRAATYALPPMARQSYCHW